MLLKTRKIFHSSCRFVQALYVSGDKTWRNTRVISPVLDFENRLGDRTEIENSINRRGLSSSLNIIDICAQWDLYKTVENKKLEIEQRQKQLQRNVKKTTKSEPSTDRENTLRKYKLEEEVLRQDLHNLLKYHLEIEGTFINSFLSIPNNVLDKAPDQENIIFTYGKQSTEECVHHLSYNDSIDYYNQFSYYLTANAAKFDTFFPINCLDHFKSHGFVHLSNPDFVKTVLVEGAGLNVNDVFEVQHHHHENHTNLLHLVGNSSILSYLGFITRLRVYGTLLPVQWISIGKIYRRSISNSFGLYDHHQSTGVQIFIAGTKEQIFDKFNDTLNLISKFYESTGIHFRIVEIPANQLKMAECFAIRIEMYSPHFKKYIEIGNLSNYSDFISKRLSFIYEKDKKNNICDFPYILSGKICNVTRLLAILLESNNGKIPNHLLEN